MSTRQPNGRWSTMLVPWLGPWLCGCILLLSAAGCGEEELPATSQRGVPGAQKKKADKAARQPIARPAGGTTVMTDDPLAAEDEGPGVKRPAPTLDQTSFTRRRDPFRGFVAAEPVQPEPDPIRAERSVQMRQYSFEDLRLVAIANTRRSGVRPRALFVAGDGISGSVSQGQFFSSAEVLLAAVNRDYVEIEVVDEDLAASLGMQRGERRALYLRKD
ncbi:MAG: hypothetical protein AB1Z98_33750 [Nannocystaceae bacterium]